MAELPQDIQHFFCFPDAKCPNVQIIVKSDNLSKLYDVKIHSFSKPLIPCTGSLAEIPTVIGWEAGYTMTGSQFITGLTYKDKQVFTLTFTPTGTHLWSIGRHQESVTKNLFALTSRQRCGCEQDKDLNIVTSIKYPYWKAHNTLPGSKFCWASCLSNTNFPSQQNQHGKQRTCLWFQPWGAE